MARLPDMPRVARIVELSHLISIRPKQLTRAALANHFGVSERTITSDLELMRYDLRMAIESERGQGYYFVSIPQLPAIAYTLPEALALILAAYSARQVSGVPRQDLASAIARLSAVMPTELQAMLDRFDGGGEESDVASHRSVMLARLSTARSMQQPVEIVYQAASEESDETVRVIEPYEIVPYGRSWHVVGFCRLRNDFRYFKIDRIQRATVRQGTFVRRDDFDPDRFLNEGWGLMRGVDGPVEEVELLFHQPSATWVAEEEWHSSQRIERLASGDVLFNVRITVTPEFQRWVFRYGRDVEVLQPGHLREWIVEEASAVAARRSTADLSRESA